VIALVVIVQLTPWSYVPAVQINDPGNVISSGTVKVIESEVRIGIKDCMVNL
jgi:hypothetical protein